MGSKTPASKQWVTCKFPGTTYKPSATDDFIEFTLGDSWRLAGGGKQDVVERHRVVDPVGAFNEAQKAATDNSRAVAAAIHEFAAFSREEVSKYSYRPFRTERNGVH